MEIPLKAGRPLFVVGPNGSGKSALIQHAVRTIGTDNVRRISAHRQTWLQSGDIDLTPQARRGFEESRIREEREDIYRWQEWAPEQQLGSVLFDLVAKDNDLARRIMEHTYAEDQEAVDTIKDSERPVFGQLNNLLKSSGLAVTIENAAGEEILARHQNASEPYSIAQMSDGERNAVILAASVLTVEANTILLIDEPERHRLLSRSFQHCLPNVPTVLL